MVSLGMSYVPDGCWKVVRWVIRWTGCMIITCLQGSTSTIWLINPGKWTNGACPSSESGSCWCGRTTKHVCIAPSSGTCQIAWINPVSCSCVWGFWNWIALFPSCKCWQLKVEVFTLPLLFQADSVRLWAVRMEILLLCKCCNFPVSFRCLSRHFLSDLSVQQTFPMDFWWTSNGLPMDFRWTSDGLSMD